MLGEMESFRSGIIVSRSMIRISDLDIIFFRLKIGLLLWLLG